MKENAFDILLKRLARAGFKRDFVQSAILPDWWEPPCAQDPALLTDIEVRIARFLGIGVSEVRSGKALSTPIYEGARLRQVRTVSADRVAPAVHAAVQIAGAVVRSLRDGGSAIDIPPPSGLNWRATFGALTKPLGLELLLADLWSRGIPVIPLQVVPRPSFQAMACVVEGRPVVVLGHQHDEPGRVAFIVAHEAGHIAAGDCSPGRPAVDEVEDEPEESAAAENRAERYAVEVLSGGQSIPAVAAADPFELARNAAAAEREHGIDAGTVIYAWARGSRDYRGARRAMEALYKARGARVLLRRQLHQHLNAEGASDTDRMLLSCVFGGAAVHAGPH